MENVQLANLPIGIQNFEIERFLSTTLMKQDIKNNELQERQTYVPASVKVIEFTAQGIICQSGGTYNDPFGEPETI